MRCGRGCPDSGEPGEPGVYLSLSKGMCRECGELAQVRYVSYDDKVYLERRCPEHGVSRALVAESLAWYLEALRSPSLSSQPPRPPLHQIEKKAPCPHGCGPCTFHAQSCRLPVFSITNACNLRCPICFTYNRADKKYFMSPEEFEKHIDFVAEAAGGVDLVNITGGEPTLHPQLFELLEIADRPGIGRVTMNTNGLVLAKEPDMARRLSELGVYAVMSLDTLDAERSVRLHGLDITAEKMRALENLAANKVQTTLLMVLVGGVNEDELGKLLELLAGYENVRSLTIQTMTYTGQGGGGFGPRSHIPVDQVERLIEEASSGMIAKKDFMPLPTAHPLCYGVNYFLNSGDGKLHSFSDLVEKQTMAECLADGYLLQPTDRFENELKASIDRLWSEGEKPELLKALKSMLRSIYPPGKTLSIHERQQKAEALVKTIYVHAHMDEDTYELGRAMRCPDQVPVNAEKLVGACNYNLFYRRQDERFWQEGQ